MIIVYVNLDYRFEFHCYIQKTNNKQFIVLFYPNEIPVINERKQWIQSQLARRQRQKQEYFKQDSSLLLQLPRMSESQLMGPTIRKDQVQNIPPRFTPVDPSLYLINGHVKNFTRIEEEKHMSRYAVVERFNQERKARQQKLIDLRNQTNPSIPYSEVELREAVLLGNNISSVTINRPRYEFYTMDPNFANYSSPLLMDGFTYCEGTTLVAEVIFNIRYMYLSMGRINTLKRIKDLWVCEHHGVNVTNQFRHDPHKHVIITEFKFNDSCHLSKDHHYQLYDLTYNYYYNATLEFLPDFTQQRYFLSLCTSLEEAPVGLVRAYIHHHFFHGVQHFVFYINGQLEFWKQELRFYAERGLVEVIDFTFPNHGPFFEQATIINSCGRRYRYHSQFMIFTDVDEFLLPINPNWRVVDVLNLYDAVFPHVDAFSIRNTFYSCPYNPLNWDYSMQIEKVCPQRWAKVIKGLRQKNIVRMRTVEYVQVHEIGYGKRMYIDHHLDMVMVHFKTQNRRNPGVAIVNNPFVSKALERTLF